MEENVGQVVCFERICRLCLSDKTTLTDIFQPTTDNNNFSIEQKIMACARITLSKDDGLPSRICVKCLTSVNAAFDFRVQCENADKTLHVLHNLLTSETSKPKSNKVTAMIDTDDVSGNGNKMTEKDAEKDNEKEKIDIEQVILLKKAGNDNKFEEDNGTLLYIIKENDDCLMEGTLSEAEIIYLDNGRNSELSPTESADGKDVAEIECIDEEKEVLEEEEEMEEELEEVEEEVGEEMEEVVEKVDENVSAEREADCENANFELKIDSSKDKSYKILTKSSVGRPPIKPQVKTSRRTGDEMQKAPCPFCHKMLARVDEHVRLMHRNRVYICNKFGCGARFATLKNLQSHQLSCYDVQKAYKCPYCLKEFHRKSNYKAHLKRHNNKKDFKCQLCDSAFVDTTGLRRHFLKHHEPERELFVSSCCGKSFKSKEGLKKHINKRICGIQVLEVVEPSSIEVPM